MNLGTSKYDKFNYCINCQVWIKKTRAQEAKCPFCRLRVRTKARDGGKNGKVKKFAA
jgi:DNA-directed RNA polymerase subunit RPC12/RpoP